VVVELSGETFDKADNVKNMGECMLAALFFLVILQLLLGDSIQLWGIIQTFFAGTLGLVLLWLFYRRTK
jgi:hypothetical protein